MTKASMISISFAPAEMFDALNDYLSKHAPGLIEGRRVSAITEQQGGMSGRFKIDLGPDDKPPSA